MKNVDSCPHTAAATKVSFMHYMDKSVAWAYLKRIPWAKF